MPLAVFRCDASPTIGGGHAARCLALAEALTDAGWRVRFVVGPETVATMPDVAAFHPHVSLSADDDVPAMRTAAGEGAALVVVDHYGRDASFETACRPFARKILAFDDMTGRGHNCDFLLDAAAGGAEQYRGRIRERALVLAGPAYAVVRKSFTVARMTALSRRDGRPVRNILVSCGATDPFNATAAVLDALADLPSDVAVTVVLSSKAPHIEAVRRKLRPGAKLITDAKNMAELMSQADLAIGAPGSTSYERAVLGLPSIVITVADNQRGIAAMTIDAGAALDAGRPDADLAARLRPLVARLLQDSELRERMARAAATLVDGRAALRVMLACHEPACAKDGSPVRLRLAEQGDEAWVLQLQRQPATRRFFRNPTVPTAAEHHVWMQRTLENPAKLLFMVEADGKSAGTLRLDRQADNGSACYEVAIAVDAAQSNRGIGSAALGLIRQMLPGAQFQAQIAAENVVSQHIFADAGYQPSEPGRGRSPFAVWKSTKPSV